MKFNDKVITVSKIIPCNLDLMWTKWTTKEGLKSFFSHDNNIELKIGGKFEIYFLQEAPLGLRGSEGCKVLSFLPKQMLSFSWNAPPQFVEVRNSGYYTWVVLLFNKITENETEIILSHYGWPDDELWNLVYNYFSQAWPVVINWLYQSCIKN